MVVLKVHPTFFRYIFSSSALHGKSLAIYFIDIYIDEFQQQVCCNQPNAQAYEIFRSFIYIRRHCKFSVSRPTRAMVVNGFQNSRRDCQFFKWTLLFCLFQFWVSNSIQTSSLLQVFNSFWYYSEIKNPLDVNLILISSNSSIIQVDSYRTFGLPSHKAFPRHFTVNNNKWIFRENAKKREYSNKQRENIHGSSVLTAGETHRLLTIFKLADQEKDEHLSNSFKRQLKKTYHTAKARAKEKPLWQQRAKTSVQLRKKITRKDYVFRDITQNEILNSYGE